MDFPGWMWEGRGFAHPDVGWCGRLGIAFAVVNNKAVERMTWTFMLLGVNNSQESS